MTTKEIKTGDAAPHFSLSDQHGNTVDSKDLHGKKTIIFFYPAAMTP
ncbi:MAG: redoxin domain-containing protein, partial [Microbacteriaceae bacterium]|nr:redoxin domain-containing protein [Microbacteriaceae bacterium]